MKFSDSVIYDFKIQNMGKAIMKSGVVVITLTATVYNGNVRSTYSSRVGFAGEYNRAILSKMGKEFKKLYAEQIEADYKDVPVKPTKIVYRVSTRSTECEMILGGK